MPRSTFRPGCTENTAPQTPQVRSLVSFRVRLRWIAAVALGGALATMPFVGQQVVPRPVVASFAGLALGATGDLPLSGAPDTTIVGTQVFGVPTKATARVRVIALWANLRSAPTKDAAAVTQLKQGAVLRVLDMNDTWYRAETARGTRGWIAASVVQPLVDGIKEQATAQTTPAFDPNPTDTPLPTPPAGTPAPTDTPAPEPTPVPDPAHTPDPVATPDPADEPADAPDPQTVPTPPAEPTPEPTAPVEQPSDDGAFGRDIAEIALHYVGYPYRYGAAGPKAFDCSGLTSYVYKQKGVDLPHNARAQSRGAGLHIANMRDLQPGDLVFFRNTGGHGGISHAAIYVGNNQIVTANSPRQGVQIDTITDSYWRKHWAGGLRPAH